MIITTAGNDTPYLIEKSLRLSAKYGIKYHIRRGKSLKYLLENIDSQIFVVNNMRGLSYYEKDGEEHFYHPNMAFHRIMNLKKGYTDSMAEACKLESGMTFFDATLGLASDSLVASFTVGEAGKVTATEKNFVIYILAQEGLNFHAEQQPELASAIERININNADNIDFLRQCGDSSFDIVYFDFMFSNPIRGSTGIQVIRRLAAHDVMTENHVNEAVRVARERVAVKSDKESASELGKIGFKIEKEKSRKSFYYAILEK